MKKKIFAALLSTFMIASMIGCGQDSSGSSSTSASTSDQVSETTSDSAETGESSSSEETSTDTSAETTEETSASSGDTRELSWYLGEAESHPWSQMSYEIADEINERTNGELTIKVYPGATLGTQSEALEMLRTGSLAFEITGPSILASYLDQIQVFSLPYAFDSAEQAYAYFESDTSQEMFNETILNASGVRTLDVWYYGDRNLTTQDIDVETPEDLSGKQIRCMDTPISKVVVKALGANPVPINMSELYLSLQTGVVEGQENPIPTIIAQKFYEVQNRLILTKHSVHLGTVEVSEQIWQSLTDSQREVITEVLAEYRPKIQERIEQESEEGLTQLEEEGMTVIEPDIDAFKENAEKVIEEELGDDPDWEAAIEDLNNFKASYTSN